MTLVVFRSIDNKSCMDPKPLTCLEQVAISTNQLINTLRLLQQLGGSEIANATFLHQRLVELEPLKIVVTGAQYYGAKDALLQHEQVLLRTLQFNVLVLQPHSYMLSLCKGLNIISTDIVTSAIVLLNDCLTHTALCVKYSAQNLAAAAIIMAAALVEVAKGKMSSTCTQIPEFLEKACVDLKSVYPVVTELFEMWAKLQTERHRSYEAAIT